MACGRCGAPTELIRGICRVCFYLPHGLLPPEPDTGRPCGTPGCERHALKGAVYCGRCAAQRRTATNRAATRRHRSLVRT